MSLNEVLDLIFTPNLILSPLFHPNLENSSYAHDNTNLGDNDGVEDVSVDWQF